MIKPYYQDDWTTIYNADCYDILPDLQKVDLVLTDPPYGINIISGGGRGINGWRDFKIDGDWDNYKPTVELFNLLLTKANSLIIWGGNYFTDMLPPTSCWLIWDKMQRDFSLADCEMAWCNQLKASRIFSYSRGLANQSNGLHPTQKPEPLMTWCLIKMPEAYIILDPFMGSGTTLIAAKKLGRKSIGIDISQKYCDIAIQRLQQTVMNFDQPKEVIEQTKLSI
jgi:DNA modification methylase